MWLQIGCYIRFGNKWVLVSKQQSVSLNKVQSVPFLLHMLKIWWVYGDMMNIILSCKMLELFCQNVSFAFVKLVILHVIPCCITWPVTSACSTRLTFHLCVLKLLHTHRWSHWNTRGFLQYISETEIWTIVSQKSVLFGPECLNICCHFIVRSLNIYQMQW